MKKAIAVMLSVAVMIAVAVCLWFYGYYSRKSNDNIPSKELMVTYYEEKGVDYASEKIIGYANTQLSEVWGKPQGQLSGFWGDIWEAGDYNIIVYYDSNGKAELVKFDK